MFKYFLYRIAQFIVERLPLKLAYQFSTFLSDMQHRFSHVDRKAVTNNIRVILKDKKDVSIEVRDVFRNFGRYLVEFFRMSKYVDKQYIDDNVEFINVKVIDDVLKMGKGGVVLTGHIGNWELGGVILGLLGYPTTVIALPHKERPVNDLFNKQRQEKGIGVVSSKSAVRTCIKLLRNNELVAVVADRDFSENGEVLNFLGKKAIIPKGAAVFACRTGSPIIPCFLKRGENDKFIFTFFDPIVPPQHTNKKAVDQKILLKVMRQCTTVIEDQIKESPSQWLMFREFWVK